MRWVLEPFARVAGIKEHRSVVRFAEQGYAMTYASEYRLDARLRSELIRAEQSFRSALDSCVLASLLQVYSRLTCAYR